MSQHNAGSRTFLLIVLAGILIGFVIAFFLLGGGEEKADVKVEHPMAQEPAGDQAPKEEPAAAEAEAPADDMSNDMTPPDEMSDDMTPPDEMVDEPLPDEAPDAMTPDAMAPDATLENAEPVNPPTTPNP